MADIVARDALVKEVTPVIGTFDHALMSTEEVAKYAADKLELGAPAGTERVAVSAYLKAHKAAPAAAFALDNAMKPKSDGLLAKRLAKKSA